MINNYINKNKLSSDKNDIKNKEKVSKLLSGLSEKQASALKDLLNNPEKSQKILSSPAAKALFKKLGK